MDKIHGYHAHIYFNQETMEQAKTLCETARDQFSIEMGRMHAKNVGPHLAWSCQLAFPANKFAQVFPWLVLNRNGLTVFTHPETGDHLLDHTEHAIWMGEILPLNLDTLR